MSAVVISRTAYYLKTLFPFAEKKAISEISFAHKGGGSVNAKVCEIWHLLLILHLYDSKTSAFV